MEEPQTWRHGYALAKLTGLKSGTLYPLLMRLESQDLLTSQWQAVQQQGRPPRHLYRLTSAGLALARERERAARIWCDETANVRIHGETHRRPVDLFEADRSMLKAPNANPYDLARVLTLRASPQFRVRVDTNRFPLLQPLGFQLGHLKPRPRVESLCARYLCGS